MAVFMQNICKFDDCGITFPSLADLILHIEDTHIDYDPAVIEQKEQQQPPCLPLSYVLKFYSNTARRESQIVDIKRRLIQHASKSAAATQNYNNSSPATPHEQDEEEAVTESEDSNESWTTSEEFSAEYILKYGSRMSSQSSSVTSPDKPFVCPVPGCKKRYKNINGIKYHSKNGHKKDGKVKKGYKCHCGKSYKTAQGLKNHANVQHVYSGACQTHVDVQNSAQFMETPVTNARPVVCKQQQQVNGGSVKSAVPKQTDPKTIEAIKLKSIAESNKKLLAAKVQQKVRLGSEGALLESDLSLLTPATSPESQSLTTTAATHILEYKMNTAIATCDNKINNNY